MGVDVDFFSIFSTESNKSSFSSQEVHFRWFHQGQKLKIIKIEFFKFIKYNFLNDKNIFSKSHRLKIGWRCWFFSRINETPQLLVSSARFGAQNYSFQHVWWQREISLWNAKEEGKYWWFRRFSCPEDLHCGCSLDMTHLAIVFKKTPKTRGIITFKPAGSPAIAWGAAANCSKGFSS